MLQCSQIQEFVAEARGRDALMTTRRSRRYQRGSICRSVNGEVWYGKYYPAPGAPQKRVQLGRTSEIDERDARTALDDIVAELNRNPAHALGSEPVRRFVEQVYVSQKYENGDWRRATGQEAEGLFRRAILPEIGEVPVPGPQGRKFAWCAAQIGELGLELWVGQSGEVCIGGYR